jgi:hypothetical protein
VISSRIHLHVLALLLAPALAWLGLWLAAQQEEASLTDVTPFYLAAVIAAQLAAWLGGSQLQRNRRASTLKACLIGLGAGLNTHLLFGPLVLLLQLLLSGSTGGHLSGGGLLFALVFSLYSLVCVGWLSLPLTALIAHLFHAFRREEPSRAVV